MLWPIAIIVVGVCAVVLAAIVAVYRKPKEAEQLVKVLHAVAVPVWAMVPWGRRHGGADGGDTSGTGDGGAR